MEDESKKTNSSTNVASGKGAQAAGRDNFKIGKVKNSLVITGDNNKIENYAGSLVIPLLDEKGVPKSDSGKILKLIIPKKLATKIFGSSAKAQQALISICVGDIEPIRKIFSNQKVQEALDEKNIKINYVDRKNNAVLKKMLDRAIDARATRTKKDGSIMAESVFSSLKENKDSIPSVKEFASKAKNRFFYFISAITKKKDTDENTLEYKVANFLKNKLGSENVFWWEDPIDCDNRKQSDGEIDSTKKWLVSTKIAMGLGFSSVFIGLAFDTVEATDNGYKFKCLLEGSDAYKTPEYFRYEAMTFITFLRNKKNSENFVKNVVDKKDYKMFVPQDRKMRIYAYGEPDRSQNSYKIIDDLEKRNGFYIDTANGDFKKAREQITDDNELANAIAEKILDKIHEEQRNGTLPNCLQATDYSYLFKPFNPDLAKWNDGKYCDDFLKGVTECKENVDMVPSDYFFEYAIIDEAGKNAKNHFLVFPERKTTRKGDFTWDLRLVVRDWNLNSVDSKVYSKESSDGEHKASFCAYTKIKWENKEWKHSAELQDGNKYEINNCTYLLIENVFDNNNGLIKGKITLSGDAASDSREFYLCVNFYPKHIIRYTISDGKIVLKRKDKKLNNMLVKVARGSKNRVNCLTDDFAGEPQIISEIRDFPIIGRLGLMEEERKKYILLPDFIPEAVSDTNQKLDNVYKTNTSNNKCIYCGRPVKFISGLTVLDYKECQQRVDKNNRRCQYNFINDAFKLFDAIEAAKNGGGSDKQEGDIVDDKLYTGEDEYNAEEGQLPPLPSKEEYELELPKDITKSAIISLVGASQSGKSTFISALFGVRDKMASYQYIKNSLSDYVEETSFYTARSKDSPLKDPVNKLFLNKKYSLNTYAASVEKTTTNSFAIPHIPFILKLDKIQNREEVAYLSFYDAPGSFTIEENESTDKYESAFGEKNEDFLMIFKSDCIVLLVNGNKQKGAADLDLRGAFTILEGIEESKYIKFEEFKKNTLLAVVVCRFDEIAKNFAEDSFIRSAPPVADTNLFDGSALSKHIDICSKEIEAYLVSKNQGAFIDKVNEYSNHKYFAVSSIGTGDTIIKTSEKSVKENKPIEKVAYFREPHNIEHILFWIMHNKGIIE